MDCDGAWPSVRVGLPEATEAMAQLKSEDTGKCWFQAAI